MNSKHLLVGASALAFAAATPAFAQTTTTGTNTSTTSGCSTASGNTCTVTQNDPQNDRNQSTIRISGTGNDVTVRQVGDDNRSFADITGDTNTVQHDQVGDEHFASSSITGEENVSEIFQRDEANSATTTQRGTSNESYVDQGFGLGQDNTATTLQVGSDLYSEIDQNGNGTVSASNNVATVDLGNDGTPSVSGGDTQQSFIQQFTNGNTARVLIRGGANNASGEGTNSSDIIQTNTLFRTNSAGTGFSPGAPTATNNPNSGNVADVSIAGLGNESTIRQDGVQNTATVSINRGGTGTSGSGATAGATGSFDGLGFQSGRRAGNDVNVDQTGRNLTALISVGGRTASQGRGNQLTLTQQGEPIAGAAGTEGANHSATVFQFGVLSDISILQENNTASTAQSTSNTTGVQSNSIADVSQSAFSSSLTLTQTGSNSAFLSQGGGSSDVGSPNNAAGNGGTSGNNRLTVSQIDAGDTAGTTSSDPFGGGSTSPSTPRRNSVLGSQAGRFNVVDVRQNATNASATFFQRRGSSSATITIDQGTGAAGGSTAAGASVNLTASVDQGGSALATLSQDGSNLNATIMQNPANFSDAGTGTTGPVAGVNRVPQVTVTQTGSRNSASVLQNGSFTSATVEQRNTNATGFTSLVRIEQAGGSSAGTNTATARQTATGTGASPATGTGSGATGPSGDADARPAGSRANEILILQTNQSVVGATSGNGNNVATVEQQGRGQYGEIRQTGNSNTAGILQGPSASNAVAIIRQSGNGNTFFVTQSQPNQFFRVVQTGSTNAATITGSGAPNGTGGTPGGEGSTTAQPVLPTVTP